MKRWFLIPAGMLIYICLGTAYSWSIFRKPLEDLLNIGVIQSGFPYMTFLAIFSVSMAISGGFIEKYPPNLMTIIGGIVVGLGWFLSGFTQNINLMTITYGVLGGVGVGIVYGIPIAVISRWFPEQKGLAIGIVISGFGLSPLITAPLARYLVDIYGPLQTFRILGFIFLILIVILGFLFKFPSEKFLLNNKNIASSVYIDTKSMLKTKKFYGLWICYMIGTLIGLMIIGITSPVGEELIKLDPKSTASLISLFAIFNALGRPIFGWLTDKFSPLNSSILSYILVIIAAIFILISPNLFVYILSFSLLWLNLGAWLAIAPATTVIFFGEKHSSKNYGIVFTAYGVGAILGTLISGILRDIFGTYLHVFYFLILSGFLGILMAFLFLREKVLNN